MILARNGAYFITPFDKLTAPLIATWVCDDRELLWLAPKTHPPITAQKIIAWTDTRGNPLLFYRDGEPNPVGYAELNPMPQQKKHLWMGHFIIQPESRGTGLGRIFVDLMLEYAFENLKVSRISLVVFPDNLAAIGCYRSTGFVDSGRQLKYFYPTGQQYSLVLMTIDRKEFKSRRQKNQSV